VEIRGIIGPAMSECLALERRGDWGAALRGAVAGGGVACARGVGILGRMIRRGSRRRDAAN
jgi:hypothetical protein